MSTALYRISSNEVVKISTKNQPFTDRNTTIWGVLTDPTTPDGIEVREEFGAGGTLGPLRVLGYAKIAETGTNNVRNALQAEIDTFEAAQTDDDNQLDAEGAGVLFDTHPRFRKLMVAYSDILKDEFNALRGYLEDLKAEVAAATSLANLKARWAGMSTLNDRTLAQLKTAIKNRINKGD